MARRKCLYYQSIFARSVTAASKKGTYTERTLGMSVDRRRRQGPLIDPFSACTDTYTAVGSRRLALILYVMQTSRNL